MTLNFETVDQVAFPKPSDRNVNMMPFILGDISTIPTDLADYVPLIDACGAEGEKGNVCYLTITESKVQSGQSQRRSGIHTERHPHNSWGGGGGWGGASRSGGIYLASTVDKSTAIWDAHIAEPGPGGNCEHLEEQLGAPKMLRANELIWMTDATPHASLPIESQERQFFRLVTSAIDVWYKDHSTFNPLVSLPSRIQVIEGNKFTGDKTTKENV